MRHATRRAFLQQAASAGVPALVLASPSAGQCASPQAKTIRVVVPAPAGGALDFFARSVAAETSRTYGRTMMIENRSGAATLIGTEAVARATPDGNTLLLNAPPAFVIAPHLRKLEFDPLANLEPICALVRFPTVIVVHSSSPYRTLSDLLDAARAKPGQVTLASIGPMSLTRIGFEMLMRAADTNMTFVPYAGPSLALNDLLGLHVASYFGNYTDAAAHLKSGKLRAIAVASQTRIDVLADVPTVSESGYRDFVVEGWFGLFAPARTPKQTVADLAGAFGAAMQAPLLRAKLANVGLYAVEVCGAEFGALIRKQHDEYGRIIREAHITAE